MGLAEDLERLRAEAMRGPTDEQIRRSMTQIVSPQMYEWYKDYYERKTVTDVAAPTDVT